MAAPEEPKKKLETTGGGGRKGRTAVGADSFGRSPAGQRRTAVVCDRNELLRRGLRCMVSDLVEVVGEASSSAETLKLVRTERPDIVILDIDLDEDDQLRTCRDCAAQASVVVVTSSYLATKYFYQLMRIGVLGLCLKGSGPLILRKALAQGPGSKSICDPVIADWMEEDAVREVDHCLTFAERKVLARLSLRNEEIGAELNMTEMVVVKTIESIMAKLRVPTRTEAADKAMQMGCALIPRMAVIDSASGKTEEQLLAEKFAREAIDKHGS